jgi:hypothetical protein
MNTPVALIIFNRPNVTEKVFTQIAKVRPKKLFVIADGPREENPDDIVKTAQARAIVERLDWDCEVLRNYSDVNLGCGKRPVTGISWVFEHVEEAIILEDDCVPHLTFFRFCTELLEKYRNDDRVMMISGRAGQLVRKQEPYSYGFRRMPSCWGWATWRRAWQHYDIEIDAWPALRNTSWLLNTLGDPRAVNFYRGVFDKAFHASGNIDYWDYQWAFTCWHKNGLVATPNINLVQNIGFGKDATHTRWKNNPAGKLLAEEMTFPLRHPRHPASDPKIDRLLIKNSVPMTEKRSFLHRKLRFLLSKIRNLLKLSN